MIAVWQRRGLPAFALFPFSLVFRVLVAVRRMLYRAGFLKVDRLPVPVVVVGNLSVGGTGKTPLVIHLAERLRAGGRNPGIVSRGYRGSAGRVLEVTAASDPSAVGDEPALIHARTGCPVFVGVDRSAAARALLAAHPRCDLILADDGLQHYRLGRDVEIALFDERGLMNGWCLPAGPLRESAARLAEVDAVVLNGIAVPPAPTLRTPVFAMRLEDESFRRLDDPQIRCQPADLAGKSLHAIAGIGVPRRFFDRLAALGLHFIAHAFADHHDYRAGDLAFAGDAILTTEKDAVKLARLPLPLPVWVLPMTVATRPDLAAFVLEKLDGCPPA